MAYERVEPTYKVANSKGGKVYSEEHTWFTVKSVHGLQ